VRAVVDVTPLSHPRTGIGNYLVGMLRGLGAAAGERHELVAFAPVGIRKRARLASLVSQLPVRSRLIPLPPSAHLWRTLWSRAGRPPVEWLAGSLDVFHFSDWMYPAQRSGVRATTIHDLIPVHFPEWVPAATRRMHARKYRNAAATCELVVTISEFTARDIQTHVGLPADRIAVAYPGVDERFSPAGPRASAGAPYVLSVATDEPRKNLAVLVEAMRILRGRGSDLELLLVGAGGPAAAEGVRRLGYVPDAELPALYRGAAASCYPSRFEGFGMPVVESLACGTPAVCSTHPSLDEAAGPAAWRADPDSPEHVATAIAQAVEADEARRAAGAAHAARFTWRACGEAVLAAYEARV
jgi:glycosyltransferase involved in cell wall biosynthesis